MNLSEHFALAEFTESSTGSRLGIKNVPNQQQIDALTALCVNVLEPVRAHFGPIHIDSGFRGPELNAAIKGAKDSQHMSGEAADIIVKNVSHDAVIEWIVGNIKFDQIILEFHDRAVPQSGWVHVSYRVGNLRGQALEAVIKVDAAGNKSTQYIVWKKV